jgi:hypothetical protein
MDATIIAKSGLINRLEGMALTAILQGLPASAGVVLLFRLMGSHTIVDNRYGAVIVVVVISLLNALMMPFLAARFPKLVKTSYEPLFFDASLSFSDKVTRWLAQPSASRRLLMTALMLSVLSVAVLSVR